VCQQRKYSNVFGGIIDSLFFCKNTAMFLGPASRRGNFFATALCTRTKIGLTNVHLQHIHHYSSLFTTIHRNLLIYTNTYTYIAHISDN